MLGRRVRTGLMILMVLLVGGFLFAIPGFLTVEAIDGVRVLVDGKYEAVTVGGKTVVMLEPGSYLITLEKEGYSSTSQTKVIKASEATSLKVDMRKPEVRGEALDAGDTTVVLGQKTGTVEVRSVPFRDADIQINGVNYGKTDRRLSNMPVGQIQVQVTKDGKRVAGSFTVKENQTIQLQANYALNPAQIVQLYNATFMVPELPQGIKAELIGTYGSGYIESGKSTTVMGPKHKVKYTNGQEYIDFEQSIDLDESTQVRLTAPDTALFSKILRMYTVSFDSQGGSEPGARSKYVVYGQSYGTLPTVTRNGYGFGGWWTEPNGMGQEILSTTTAAITGDQTLYAKWIVPRVGGFGPSGGYIFYDKGNYSDGWRYLEAAPASYEFIDKVWGGRGTNVGGTGTAIGTGRGNTEKIVSKFGEAEPYKGKSDYAAKLCADLVVIKDGVRYDDWFLPSQDELNLMYQNLYLNNLGNYAFLGGFSDGSYWSSSEYNASGAWYQDFGNGTQYGSGRGSADRVRPVRAF